MLLFAVAVLQLHNPRWRMRRPLNVSLLLVGAGLKVIIGHPMDHVVSCRVALWLGSWSLALS